MLAREPLHHGADHVAGIAPQHRRGKLKHPHADRIVLGLSVKIDDPLFSQRFQNVVRGRNVQPRLPRDDRDALGRSGLRQPAQDLHRALHRSDVFLGFRRLHPIFLLSEWLSL